MNYILGLTRNYRKYRIMNPDHSDSDSGSIFTVKTSTTAPTEWTSEEDIDSRDESDVMSVLDSLYVIGSVASISVRSESTGYLHGDTDMVVTRRIHYRPAS